MENSIELVVTLGAPSYYIKEGFKVDIARAFNNEKQGDSIIDTGIYKDRISNSLLLYDLIPK